MSMSHKIRIFHVLLIQIKNNFSVLMKSGMLAAEYETATVDGHLDRIDSAKVFEFDR